MVVLVAAVRRGLLAAGAIHEGNTGKGASRSENLGLDFRRVRRLPRTEASSDK